MEKQTYSLLLDFAREVEDFRVGNRLFYPSSSIIFMTFVATLCGAEDWSEVIEVAEASEELFREYLKEDFAGIPSHDTFSRFFSLIKPEALESAFRETMKEMHKSLIDRNEKEVVAIDGKYMAGVRGDSALNVVSAYATGSGISLGQEIADKKMNEPKALRALVNSLDLQNTIITADALHCQKESVKEIIEAGADYLITVKKNQKHLYDGIMEGIGVENMRNKQQHISHAHEINQGHGRYEVRMCHSCTHMGWLPKCGQEWIGIKSYGVISSERTNLSTGQTTTETRCFISSLDKDALQQRKINRKHWSIENNLHWQLDVSFNEDDTRMQKNQLLNLSLLRKMAMPVIKAFTYKKGASIKKKILAAALKPDIKRKLVEFALEFYQ